jgi:hypothetical protein
VSKKIANGVNSARDRSWNAFSFWAVSVTIFWEIDDGDTPNACAASRTVSSYFRAETPRRIFSNNSSENCPGECRCAYDCMGTSPRTTCRSRGRCTLTFWSPIKIDRSSCAHFWRFGSVG